MTHQLVGWFQYQDRRNKSGRSSVVLRESHRFGVDPDGSVAFSFTASGVRLYGMLGNREDAQDLRQETYEAACRYKSRWPDADGWRPWLFTIARNKAVSLRRRRALLRWVPLLASDSPAHSRDDQMSDTIGRLTLEAAMKILRPPEREAIVLRLQGFSYEEIGSICGASAVTVGGGDNPRPPGA